MRLRQLESFLAIAECGSLTLAASRLFIAQPSLSQQIADLEREVGCVLFERARRGMRLTPEGRAFLPHVQAAVKEVGTAVDAARAASKGKIGEIRIATITSLAVAVFPNLASRWHRLHPEVNLRLVEYGSPNRLEDGVRLGEADLAIGPIPTGPMYEVIEVGSEEFVIVLPDDDPLAHNEEIDLEELIDAGWVLYTRNHGLDPLVMKACSTSGFSPRAAMRTSQVEAMVRLAQAGIGPALVPSNVLRRDTHFLHPKIPLRRRLAVYSAGEMGTLETELVVNIQQEGLRGITRDAEGGYFL